MDLKGAFDAHFASCTEDMGTLPERTLNGKTVRSHGFTALVDENGDVPIGLNHFQKQLPDGSWSNVGVVQTPNGRQLRVDL